MGAGQNDWRTALTLLSARRSVGILLLPGCAVGAPAPDTELRRAEDSMAAEGGGPTAWVRRDAGSGPAMNGAEPFTPVSAAKDAADLPVSRPDASQRGMMDTGARPADAGGYKPPLPEVECHPDAGHADAGMPDASTSEVVPSELTVQYRAGDTAADNNEVRPYFIVVNGGSESVPLDELVLHYWFTREDPSQPLYFDCDYAALGCAQIMGSVHEGCGVGADTYLRLTFAGASLAAGQSSGEIQVRLHKQDWSAFDETNDYSFDGGRTSFAESARVTLYRNGQRVWGTPPY